MNEMTTLRAIEIRIAEHMKGIGQHMLSIGRCLNEAKELCAHGEWEAWVQRNTGMKMRTAQELMRAAKEVPEGSIMEQMNISMVNKILTLPEAMREDVAQQAVDNDLTVRELRAQVDRMRASLNRQTENLTKVNELKAEADRKVEVLQNLVKAASARERERKTETVYVEDPEQAAEIERLREELRLAEEEAERYSDDAQNARAELLNYKLSGGMSDGDDIRTTVRDIIGAARSFIAAAGAFPHMGDRISRMSAGDREELRLFVAQIADWAEGADAALRTEYIELRAAR